MTFHDPSVSPSSIPVVDLNGTFEDNTARRQDSARHIHQACRETGFFYVSGHGIPKALVDAQFAAAAALFALPMAERMALNMIHSPNKSGYEQLGAQRLETQDISFETAPPDLKESYQYGADLPDTHPLAARYIRGYGHNLWPSSLPGFREQASAYRDAMCGLGNHILSLIAQSLGLPEDWFEGPYESSSSMARLLRYPPRPANAVDNQIGAGAHTDWGGITLLAQDDLGGLEVRTRAGEWILAKPIPGTFVINLGDLMARWTNGVYTSNMHRVRNNRSDRARYSIAFFHSPNPDAIIAPPPQCVTSSQPLQFEPCTAAEHIDEMFRRSYGYSPHEAVA